MFFVKNNSTRSLAEDYLAIWDAGIIFRKNIYFRTKRIGENLEGRRLVGGWPIFQTDRKTNGSRADHRGDRNFRGHRDRNVRIELDRFDRKIEQVRKGNLCRGIDGPDHFHFYLKNLGVVGEGLTALRGIVPVEADDAERRVDQAEIVDGDAVEDVEIADALIFQDSRIPFDRELEANDLGKILYPNGNVDNLPYLEVVQRWRDEDQLGGDLCKLR